MIKIKLSIDPTQFKQMAALTALLNELAQPKVYPTTLAFGNPIAKPVSVEEVEGGLKIVSELVKESAAKEQEKEFKEEVKQRRATKPTPAQKAAEAQEPGEDPTLEQDQKQAEGKEATEEAAPGANVEQIREMLGKKVTDHRETIKAKLTELGAKNVSVLDASHYDAFYSFISKL